METKTKPCRQNELVVQLYKEYSPELKLFFVNYTHDMMAAEDMVQNLFMKIMRLDAILPSTARNLLFVTARRMVIDDIRRKSYAQEQLKQLRDGSRLEDGFSVFDKMERDQILQLEERKLQTMAQKRAQIYRMWRGDDKTMKEIAQELNLSTRTVETHVYLAVREMKEYIHAAI